MDCRLELGETPVSTDAGKFKCCIEDISILADRLWPFILIVVFVFFCYIATQLRLYQISISQTHDKEFIHLFFAIIPLTMLYYPFHIK